MTLQYIHPNPDWKNIRLSDINLSVRTSNCLNRMGLTTLGDLARVSETELLRQPNFGRKSLIEVRTVLSSAGGSAASDEAASEKDTLDFDLIKEPLLSTLLQPVQTLDLTTRAENVLKNSDIVTVGELIQLTQNELRRMPNVGRLTIHNYNEALSEVGFSLGTTITNWPRKDELARILKSRTQSSMDKTQTSLCPDVQVLEDELCAAVQLTVDRSGYAIIVRRTGWDGGQILTLEELGNDPVASGRMSSVSRERIRQIESKGLEKIQKKSWSMPILKRTVSLIEENAPLAAANVRSVLEQHQLSQCGLGFKALTTATRTFQVEWNLVCRTIGEELFLLPPDKADTMEAVWTFLVKEADRQDFVSLDEIESANQRATNLAPDIVALGVSRVPTLDWLDRDRRIYWSTGRVCRGWNKIVNVCRKILTVAPDVPFKRLATAVKRARTTTDHPSPDTLMSMLRALDDIDVHDGMVSRGTSFKPDNLSNADRLMINAAEDAGTVTTFLELREALVRQGVSENHAQVLMVETPLWMTPSRGKYRFIANKAQLKAFSLVAPARDDEARERRESLVELKIDYRHLVMGTHRIDENLVRPGQWLLRDEMGNELGKINVTTNMVKGLNGALAAAGIEVSTFVIIDFSDQNFTATAYY